VTEKYLFSHKLIYVSHFKLFKIVRVCQKLALRIRADRKARITRGPGNLP
jgi:hypothetical protein